MFSRTTALLAVLVLGAAPSLAEAPMSPVHPTSPAKVPAAVAPQPAAPSSTAAPKPDSPVTATPEPTSASAKPAPAPAAAGTEAELPVATAALPPPPEPPAEEAAPAAKKETAAAKHRRHVRRYRAPRYVRWYDPPAAAVETGGGQFGPAPYSASGP